MKNYSLADGTIWWATSCGMVYLLDGSHSAGHTDVIMTLYVPTGSLLVLSCV